MQRPAPETKAGKQGKSIKRKKPPIKQGRKTATKTLIKITQKSLEKAQMKKLQATCDKQKLDNLLKSNEFIRVAALSDGDCLLKAVLINCGERVTVDDLRAHICDHVIKYKENYLYVVQEASVENRENLFKEMVQDLSLPGHWNNVLGDCVPLALVNIFQINIHSLYQQLCAYT